MRVSGVRCLVVACFALACSPRGEPIVDERGSAAPDSAADDDAGFVSGGTGGTPGIDESDASDAGEGGSCAAESTAAKLRPVYLGFAFDVSGSMGKLDYPYHDPALKWDPVVAATKAFFTAPRAAGISATLTFFPIDASDEELCDPANYATPDVPMTPLPSTAFGEAIDAVTPMSTDEWRGGTPTLAVMTAMMDQLTPLAEANPDAQYAMVLVSDGYPQSCDDNSIEAVSQAVAAVADAIPTYVIGVQNPPDGPDTVSNLHLVAVAGNTEQAFIIETGDPEQTQSSLQAAIDEIRQQAVSCNIDIPPPPSGMQVDPEKVNVTYTTGSDAVSLGYDELCTADGAWRYDDALAPTQIQLCPAACDTVQADSKAALQVEFGCKRRDIIK